MSITRIISHNYRSHCTGLQESQCLYRHARPPERYCRGLLENDMGIQKQDNRDAVSDRGKWSGESVCVCVPLTYAPSSFWESLNSSRSCYLNCKQSSSLSCILKAFSIVIPTSSRRPHCTVVHVVCLVYVYYCCDFSVSFAAGVFLPVWPSKVGQPLMSGRLVITMQSEELKNGYYVRKFSIKEDRVSMCACVRACVCAACSRLPCMFLLQ